MRTNPFYNRKMIKKEEEFIGRKREIDDIINRVRGGNSVSVVGERKIGKSSLLYNLYLRGNKLLNDPEKKEYKFVYIDLQDIAMTTPERFVKEVLEKLDIRYEVDKIQENAIAEFSELLEINSKKEIKPILLIDEFEAILERRDFNNDFINALRYLANSGCITYVVSSKISLREITDKGKLTSPFWNIFVTLKLGEFSSKKEVDMFFEVYWQGLNITKEERKFLLAINTAYPLQLQITCYWLYENRKQQYSNRKLRKKINEELAGFRRNWFQRIYKFFLQNLYRIPKIFEWLLGAIKQIKGASK